MQLAHKLVAVAVPPVLALFVAACSASAGPAGATGEAGPRGPAGEAGDRGGDGGSTRACVPTEVLDCACANGSLGLLTCASDGVFGSCVCAAPGKHDGGAGMDAGEGMDAGAKGTNSITSTVQMVGAIDPGGVSVTLANPTLGVSITTTTNDAGAYTLSGVPEGSFSVTYQKTVVVPPDAGFPAKADGGPATLEYEATIPNLLELPGTNGFIDESSMVPLAPIELVAGRQVSSDDFAFEFSPDGKYVGASQPGPDPFYAAAVVSAVAGGPPVEIFATGAAIQFSPDSSHLLAATDYTLAGTFTLSLAAVAGGAPVQVATGVSFGDSGQPAQFSPDSSHFAFLADVDETTGLGSLEIAAVAGGPPVTIASSAESDFIFSPDGQHLAFLTNPDSTTQTATLSLANVASGTAVVLASNAFDEAAQFSADSSELVFDENIGGGTLEVVAVSGGTPRSFATGVGGSFQLSPDGNVAFYMTGYGTPYAATVGGGSPVQLAGPGSGATLSPDGSYVAFGTATGLELETVAGTAPRQIVPGEVASFHFSPDSKWLAVFGTDTGNGSAVYVAAVPDGAPVQLDTIPTGFAGTAPQFSPDSQYFGFIDASGLLSVSALAGGSSVTFGYAQNFVFSTEGSYVAFNFDGETALARLPAGAPVAINSYETGFFGSTFIGKTFVTAFRSGTPAPFDYQDGVYATLLP
jgi:Tol biopolymer transport system component